MIKNGNLLNLHRNGHGTELDMDRFAYNYLDINGEQSNRLDYVQDSGTDYASYDDIKTGQTTGNYKYNKLGELIEDVQENMILHWRYGDHKLAKIERTDDDSPEVEFFYNPLGVRVGKLEKPRENGQLKSQSEWKYHYYAYDANGMLMAVYDSKLYAENGLTNLEERYIYGAKRIGAIKEQVTMYNSGMALGIYTDVKDNTLGQKRYELTNHLGTVNVTVSDRKVYSTDDNHYEAVVMSYVETYAFGMLMPGRSFNADGQRFLYHGMEHDLEVSGNGNSYTTEFRQYDPRLGRWKSIDPLMSMFPHMSPYVGFDNNPIYFVDPYGLASTNNGGGGEPKKYEVESNNPWTTEDEKKLPTQDVEIGEQIIIKHKPGEKGYKTGDKTQTVYTYKGDGKYSYESRYYKSGSVRGEINLGNKNTLAVFDSYMNSDQEGINIGSSANDIAQTKPVQIQKPKEQNTAKQDAPTEPVKQSNSEQKSSTVETLDNIQTANTAATGVATVVEQQFKAAAKETPKIKTKMTPNMEVAQAQAKSMNSAAKTASKVASKLGLVSAGVNAKKAYDAYNSGNDLDAAIYTAIAIVDFALAIHPAGLAVSIGWTVVSSFW